MDEEIPHGFIDSIKVGDRVEVVYPGDYFGERGVVLSTDGGKYCLDYDNPDLEKDTIGGWGERSSLKLICDWCPRCETNPINLPDYLCKSCRYGS
jgi:hypothetical protein